MRLLPEWSLPDLAVSLIFPSHRELAPSVRVFADFLADVAAADRSWQEQLSKRRFRQ